LGRVRGRGRGIEVAVVGCGRKRKREGGGQGLMKEGLLRGGQPSNELLLGVHVSAQDVTIMQRGRRMRVLVHALHAAEISGKEEGGGRGGEGEACGRGRGRGRALVCVVNFGESSDRQGEAVGA